MDYSKRNGQYTICTQRSIIPLHFFKLKGMSVLTIVRGMVNTHFVYIVPLIIPLPFLRDTLYGLL